MPSMKILKINLKFVKNLFNCKNKIMENLIKKDYSLICDYFNNNNFEKLFKNFNAINTLQMKSYLEKIETTQEFKEILKELYMFSKIYLFFPETNKYLKETFIMELRNTYPQLKPSMIKVWVLYKVCEKHNWDLKKINEITC